MISIQIASTGGPEVLQAVDAPTPTAGPGEVLVRNHAIALNFIDTYFRRGLYPLSLPSSMGSEGAGIVEAVGEGVTAFAPGDRVGYLGANFGAYAESFAVEADRVAPLPDGIGFDVAAAAMMKGMTTYALLTLVYPAKAGDTILVHAAAGGVGSIMTQWAKSLGCTVIGTVGSQAKADFANANGCDHVILYDSEDVAARVRELTGGAGVRAVYDSVGAATFEGSLASLGRRGWLVCFGNASGPPPAVEPLRLMRGGSLVLTRPNIGDFIVTHEEMLIAAKAVFDRIESGALKIDIGRRFALEDAADAHRAMESRATLGTSLLIP